MTEQINESEVLRRFHEYQEELNLNVQDAIAMIREDCRDEDMTVGETLYVVENIIIPEIMLLFAEKYDLMTNCYDYDSDEDELNKIFGTFCSCEGLSENLQNNLAAAINTAAAADEYDDDDEDDDDEAVFKPGTRRRAASDQGRRDATGRLYRCAAGCRRPRRAA